MSLQRTKELLLSLTGDAESRVIALSGKWGTGKTYLIGEAMEAAKDESVAGALSVALVGLPSIDQCKRKLIESVAPGAEAHLKIWEGAKQAVTSALKALESCWVERSARLVRVIVAEALSHVDNRSRSDRC